MTICGVYKITNRITKESYIGCSINIEKRWNSHKQRCFNIKDKEFNKLLYINIREHGIENFELTVVEECKENELFDRENYYIHHFDTIQNGYNSNGLDKHHNSKLSLDEIKDIRTRYNNLERKSEVYEDYSHKINKTGFHKIWNFTTWKDVMPEVHTNENILFHKNNTGNLGSKNGTSKLSEEDVILIRTKRKENQNRNEVYKLFENKLTKRSFDQVWYYQNWKHVVI